MAIPPRTDIETFVFGAHVQDDADSYLARSMYSERNDFSRYTSCSGPYRSPHTPPTNIYDGEPRGISAPHNWEILPYDTSRPYAPNFSTLPIEIHAKILRLLEPKDLLRAQNYSAQVNIEIAEVLGDGRLKSCDGPILREMYSEVLSGHVRVCFQKEICAQFPEACLVLPPQIYLKYVTDAAIINYLEMGNNFTSFVLHDLWEHRCSRPNLERIIETYFRRRMTLGYLDVMEKVCGTYQFRLCQYVNMYITAEQLTKLQNMWWPNNFAREITHAQRLANFAKEIKEDPRTMPNFESTIRTFVALMENTREWGVCLIYF
jgi:hypothetical protein